MSHGALAVGAVAARRELVSAALCPPDHCSSDSALLHHAPGVASSWRGGRRRPPAEELPALSLR
eukprot:CAMPEP_0170431732 /NCGR_PEP_ID=MMETSP0117_2-20130122/41562_1 /TAXON_ID=400756 /ORGANISM="Durinskia baltica, Strain CSIRO CS-38" /LENGTH=63 /DNA_ID=CAMNT_0010691315 /DNA_START=61 /DNA_END=248 /DNA_ORIENTATION=-